MGLFGKKYYSLSELSDTEKNTLIVALEKMGQADSSLDCSTLIDSIKKDKLNKTEMEAARQIAKFFRVKVLTNKGIFSEYSEAGADKSAANLKKIEDLIAKKID